MTPLDLVPEASVQEMLDQIATEYSVYTTLQDSEGIILLGSGNHSDVCKWILTKPTLVCVVCGAANTRFFETAIDKGRHHSEQCKVGMFKTVVPIFHRGTFIGGFSACGAALEKEKLEAALMSRFLDIDQQKAEALIKEATFITEQQGQQIAESFARGFQSLLEEVTKAEARTACS